MGIWKITSMSIIFYFGAIGNCLGGLVSGSGSGSIVYATWDGRPSGYPIGYECIRV